MKKLLLVLLAVVLCSCGDDITKNTYVQEPSYLDVRTEFNEPCDPGEGALDTNGRIWICRGNGTWHKQEHFVDTIFKWQRDTVVITRTDTLVIKTDTTETEYISKSLCGKTQYDSTTHFCDERDNRVYRFVKIGSQTWMAENLNFGTKAETDGNYLYYSGTGNSAQKFCYNNDENMCDIYGGLYNRDISRNLCPFGWHIPDSLEYGELENYALENYGNTKVLRSSHIWSDDEKGSDDLGFSIIPAGILNKGMSLSSTWGYIGLGIGYGFCIKSSTNSVIYCGGSMDGKFASVRCIKDN